MIEPLACRTPVIARPCGSVPEILRNGVTGFVSSSLDGLVAAVQKIRDISRRKCRDEFESRFAGEVMPTNYERVYFPYDLERCTATLRSGRGPFDGNLFRVSNFREFFDVPLGKPKLL